MFNNNVVAHQVQIKPIDKKDECPGSIIRKEPSPDLSDILNFSTPKKWNPYFVRLNLALCLKARFERPAVYLIVP